MSLGRLTIAVASGVAMTLLIGSVLSADDGAPAPKKTPPAQIGRGVAEFSSPEFSSPPRGPNAGGRGAGAGRQGRGPARSGPPAQPPRGPFLPGSEFGGRPDRAGPPNYVGPPDQRGARRPGPPPGRPRWPHRNWDDLENRDPEMYKLLKNDDDLDRQARELLLQYRRAPNEQRAAIKKQLAEVVDKHFDARQQRRLLELKRLEEELKRLRDAINNRNEARDAIVGKRVSELLGEDTLDF